MKRILFWLATFAALTMCGCAVRRGLTLGEEFCSVGCAQFGGKMLWSEGHRCACEFELPHVTGKADVSKDNPKGVQL